MFIKQVMFTQESTKQKFTNTLCLPNKINVYNTNICKTKVYKHVMFTRQNTKQKVYKTKLNFTNTSRLQNKNFRQVMFTKQNKVKCEQTNYVYKTNKCLQNKSLQTSYVYKTKYTTTVYKHVCLQNKTNVYKTKVHRHLKFTNTLSL